MLREQYYCTVRTCNVQHYSVNLVFLTTLESHFLRFDLGPFLPTCLISRPANNLI